MILWMTPNKLWKGLSSTRESTCTVRFYNIIMAVAAPMLLPQTVSLLIFIYFFTYFMQTYASWD